MIASTTYIGLGSNIGPSEKILCQALAQIHQLPQTKLTRISAFYRSKPVGPQDQPDFINAVACIKTDLSPNDLLLTLNQIEQQYGRKRTKRWGPRTIDLDILLYDQLMIQTEVLTIPHVELTNRTFVLCPLLEIAPDLTMPDGLAIKDLLAKFGRNQYPMAIFPDPPVLYDLRTTLLAQTCTTPTKI